MERGVVKFYNENKGFGFITKEDGTDIFVHATGLIDEISNNDEVEFNVGKQSDGRSMAEKVTVTHTVNQ